jgi:SAM-dependent methyltransferase
MPLPSDLYDREYFLSEKCEGFDRFREGGGLSRLKQRELDLLNPAAGDAFLDAGCGRGEVMLAAAARGASVTGIDYSEAAVKIARATLAEVQGADVRRGDITALPWETDSFDAALLGDVIEHLDPDQADAALAELRRVLRPGGRVLVHTAPNLLFLRFAWPVARIGMRLTGRGKDAAGLDAWIAESKHYHVNEQSVFSLRAALRRAGFAEVQAWIDPDVLRSGDHHLTSGLAGPSRLTAAAARLAGTRPLRTFLGNDVYATGLAT